MPLDVSDSDAVDAAADRIEGEFGPIDVWVNDAMVSVFSPVARMTPQDFRRVTEVTYLGVVNGTLAALRHMLPRDRGRSYRSGPPWLTGASRSIRVQRGEACHPGVHRIAPCELIHDRAT